jgi:hypothetical protein
MALIPLTRGLFATVDDEDASLVSPLKWCASARGYALCVTRIDGSVSQIKMHRLILDAPPGMLVDHRDGDPLNNCKSNLRLCTSSENRKNNKTNGNRSVHRGYPKGVSPWRGKYMARIFSDGVATYLGLFSTSQDAANAYDSAAVRLHGEFARLNSTPPAAPQTVSP